MPDGAQRRPAERSGPSEGRLRFLPPSLGLGLFTGDVLTLLLRGDLTVQRAAASGLVAVIAWLGTRWAIRRYG
jgi:hypothetical protein